MGLKLLYTRYHAKCTLKPVYWLVTARTAIIYLPVGFLLLLYLLK